MSEALQKYLDCVMIYANRGEDEASQIRAEQEDHLLKKVADLEAEGLSHEDAVFQAIEDHGHPRTVGYGLRERFAFLDVRTHGTARGFIAIGPRAIGVIALGGVAVGLFAFGGLAFGAIAFGGLAFAAFISFGGLSLAPLGAALGLLVLGRFAIGIIAGGGLAVGLWVPLAIDRVSLLSGDGGLQFYLRYFRGSQERLAVIILTSWFLVLSSFLTSLTLGIQRDEHRRIKKTDPKLVE